MLFSWPGSNGTTTGDCEDVLDGHKERLVVLTLRVGDILIDCIHEFHDVVSPLAVGIFQSLQSRAADNGKVIARELILSEQITNFHLDQVKELFVINHVALVHENYDIRNTDLTCKQNVLTSLSHNTVSCSNNEDGAVHLSSTGDHVLDIVSMSGAVDVCIVSLCSLILDVRRVDGDTTLFLFGSLVDLIESNSLAALADSENAGDCSGQCGFVLSKCAFAIV